MGAGIAPGAVLAGKYRVDRLLGAGGMGVVLQGYHLQLEEPVAIKMLLPKLLANRDAVTRFEREARAAFKIRGEHVVRVYDVDTLPSGAPYMVMEFLEGTDLAAVLEQRRALPVEDAIEYLLQACEAVAEGHKAGIVHRDLKPENLFLAKRADGSPCVKVLDFGLSKKIVKDSDSSRERSLTAHSATMGTPYYMSPEQWASAKNVGVGTDIWALGAIFYELLTGRHAFGGDSIPELYACIMVSQPANFTEIGCEAAAGIEPIIRRCLEKDPSQRWTSVGELAMALAPFGNARSRMSAERIAGMLGVATTSASPAELAQLGTPPGARTQLQSPALPLNTAASWQQNVTDGSVRRQRAPARLAVGALLGVVVVGGGTAFMLTRGGAASESAAASAEEPAPPSADAPASPTAATSVSSASEAPEISASATASATATALASVAAPPVAPPLQRPKAPAGGTVAPPSGSQSNKDRVRGALEDR